MTEKSYPAPDASECQMVPMRDGVGLYTEIFISKGKAGPLPTVLVRTPYPSSTFSLDRLKIGLFLEAGYILAVQWVRGTWKSEGRFQFLRNEAKDGYDTIEWLAEQSWCNGKVGMFGTSYNATVQWLAASEKPPHLSCIAPISPAGMFFNETPYIGGAPCKLQLLMWPKYVGCHDWADIGFDYPVDIDNMTDDHPLLKAYRQSPNDALLDDWHAPVFAEDARSQLEHSTLDKWWEEIMITPEKAAEINIPIFTMAGYFDGDLIGCLHNWDTIEKANPVAKSIRYLTLGPWRHAQMTTGQAGTMGEVNFGENASANILDLICKFFDVYLKGMDPRKADFPKNVRCFISGKNIWKEFEAYPIPDAQDTVFYLDSSGAAQSLDGDGILKNCPVKDSVPDHLPEDVNDLVPPMDSGQDTRENLARNDVLVYTGQPLVHDLTVLGSTEAVIYLRADVLDADVVVRIEDVYPDGRSVNLTGEFGCAPFRARYREGYDKEVPLIPGEVAELSFPICHMGHNFKIGHSVRIVITATVDKIIEPNHHTFEPVLTAVERRPADLWIFHDGDHPSRVILPSITL